MWTYNFTDYDNDFLAHKGVPGMSWGKHLPYVLAKLRDRKNAARAARMQETASKLSGRSESSQSSTANSSSISNTATSSSGRKRNVSGEATGSVEKRGDGLGTGSVNPNGTYNRTASNTASASSSTSSSGSKEKTAFQKWNERFDMSKKYTEATRSNSAQTKGNVSSEYLAEVESNSQTNGSSGTSQKKKKADVTVDPNNVSSEYLAEVESNSQTNDWSGATSVNGKPVASISAKEAVSKVSNAIKSYVNNFFGFGKSKKTVESKRRPINRYITK